MTQPETRTLIDGPAGALEVAVRRAPAAKKLFGRDYCAVICHPHPLYGGALDNKVVTTLARVYGELGVSAVCFNFRGVGQSAGGHDDGRGEVDDLLSVAGWAGQQFPDADLLLAGYSFGAAIAARGCGELSPAHLTLVAPPIGRYGLAADGDFPCPVCVVMGGQDELVDSRAVVTWAQKLEPPAMVLCLPDANHFFHGQLVALCTELRAALLASLR